MSGNFFSVAFAVARRGVKLFFTNPAVLLPAVAFPLFFLAAFAGGLSRVADIPNFDYPAGYTAFQYVWILLQSVALGGAFTGFAIARDFESGFATRFMLAAHRRGGIVLGYMLVSLVRIMVTGGVATTAALIGGMQVLGGPVDLFGLVTLALTVNVAATLFASGMAMIIRTSQGGFLIQTPIFLALFLSPVFVPYELLEGWIKSAAAYNPITFILEAARGFMAGNPTEIAVAYALGVLLILVFIPWALFGLRRAERAG